MKVKIRVVNRSVLIQVHHGLGTETETVKENVELDLDPEPFWNRFLSSGIETKTIYGTGLDLGPSLSKE